MKYRLRSLGALLAVLCMGFSLIPITANAGSSKITIDGASFSEKIDNTVWNNPNSDVAVDAGKLVFPAESTADTRLISKTAVSKSDLIEDMLRATFTVEATAIPEGKAFLFAIGLRSIESLPGEKGNIEIALQNKGGIFANVSAYESSDTATALADGKQLSGNKFAFEVQLTTKQHLTVKINNLTVYDGEIPVTGEGRIGFLQTGGCHVAVSEMKIENFSYNTPENVNVNETFDNGTMDTSVLTSSMIKDYGYYPCRISVDKYLGNDVMLFKNSGLGYIGTKYQYSNFEMTFDIPYYQRTEVYSENFELLTPKSAWFGISFGDEYIDTSWYDYDYKSPYMIYFDEWSQIRDLKNNHKILATLGDTGHAFFTDGEERGFSVKMTVMDARVTIGVKWMEEEAFTTVCEYDIANGQTPTGYIHIWGSEPNNFAIDNIVITNKDTGAQLTQTEYKAGKVVVPEDYAYEKAEMIFKSTDGNEEDTDNGFNWYLLIPCAGGVCLLCILGSVIISSRRKKKGVA